MKKESNKMDRTFYRSLVTNKIFDNSDLERFCQIDNGVSFKNLLDAKKISRNKSLPLDNCSASESALL